MICNTVKIYYVVNGEEKEYKGDIYIDNGDNTVTKIDRSVLIDATNKEQINDEEHDAGIPDDLLGKTLCFPVPFDLNSTNPYGVTIRIKNEYNTFASRFIFCYKKEKKQNQGILRGKVIKNNSSVDFSYVGPGVKITKTVAKVDEAPASNGAYVEKDCNVTYNITLTCTGSGSIKNIKFTDYVPDGLEYFGCTGLSTTDNSNFTYVGPISAGYSAQATITYKVKAQHSNYSNIPITNKVEITSVYSGYDNLIYQKGGVNYLYWDYNLISSATVYMKKYAVSITKTANMNVAEYGDTVTFTIVVKNTGISPTHGSFKNIVVQDVLPSGFTFSSYSGNNWSKVGNDFTYNQTLSPGGTATLTIKGNVTEIGKTITNTATITKMLSHHGNDVTIKRSASCKVKLKDYKIDINKYITVYKNANNTDSYPNRINLTETQKKNSPINLEVGDTITYRIDLNTITNDDYGQIKSLYMKDEFDEGLELKRINLRQDAHSPIKSIDITNPEESFSVYNSGIWGTYDAIRYEPNKITIKGLDPENCPYITLDFTVVHRSKTEDVLKNTISITSMNNKNGELPFNKVKGTHTSTEYVKTKIYGVNIIKTVTKVISSSNNKTTTYSRETLNNTQKYDKPVEVEKGDKVEYVIKIKNIKNTTLYNLKVDDSFEGIKFSSADVTMTVNGKNIDNLFDSHGGYKVRFRGEEQVPILQGWYLENKNIPNGGLKSNAQLEIKINATVTASNMTLLNCLNQIDMVKVENKNGIVIKDSGDNTLTDILNDSKDKNKEYIRLKNLIISGTVWQDNDKDGVLENGEPKLQGIEVELHDDTNKKVATTYTDKNGKYVFGETNGKNENGSTSNKKMVEGGDNSGRVIKATNRDDSTGNYTNQSKYINYYIKFRYNGVDYKSSVYSGKDNITENNNYNEKYETDSNAMEYQDERQAFNEKLSLIGYNKSINQYKNNQETVLSFNKNGHVSKLVLDENTKMNAYSFIIRGKNGLTGVQNGNNIDMLFFNSNQSSAETEYLKYINLGLEKRAELDLKATKDLMFTQVRINGHSLDYDFGQIPSNALYYGEGSNGEEAYKMHVYKSDYYYRYTMYENDEVRKLKGEASELQLDLNYKITITNESIGDTFATINEIVDFYSDKMELKPGVYMQKNGQTIPLNTYNSSIYNKKENYNFENKGYKTLFIRGMDQVPLKTNEKLDIYISYALKKDDDRSIMLGEIGNIAQISAYATYTDQNCNNPEGLVDKDSNAGNLNRNGVDIDNTKLYEDNTFRVKTDIELKEGTKDPDTDKPENNERKITGFVYEDARSILVSEKSNNAKDINQYVGNGEYITSDKKHENLNKLIKDKGLEFINQDLNKDTKLKGMTVELIEIVNVNGTLYEETLNYSEIKDDDFADVVVQTGEEGKYTLQSFIPGTYIVRFRYGDIYVDKNMNEKMSENSLIHNGQDYKSTTFTLKDKSGNSLESDADNDTKYEELTKANISDARDNEYRRIEIMAESETMNHEMAEKMKYTNYNANNLNDDLKDFVNKTNSFADTVTIDLGIENKSDIKTREDKSIQGMLEEYIPYGDFNSISLKVPNIDFGLSYRPENLIELDKRIKSIELKTSAENTLVKVEYDKEGNVIGVPDGMDKIQAMDSVNNMQGFRYINVDEDIMQGATIAIEYYIIANNIGEVDTVNRNLINEGSSSAVRDKLKVDENISYTMMNEKFKRGNYLGAIYYKGADISSEEKEELAIVPVTVTRIIDWVDNDATFESKENNKNGRYWIATTEIDLLGNKLISKNSLDEDGYYKDERGRKYTTDEKKNIIISANSENDTLVKPITPTEESYIEVKINGVLGAGTDENNMTYENIAELAEFVTIVGRRTNFAATVGNIDLTKDGITPFEEAYEEKDSTGTETVNLIPPTGLVKYKLFMAKNGVTILTVLIALVLLIQGSIICKKVIFKKKIYK